MKKIILALIVSLMVPAAALAEQALPQTGQTPALKIEQVNTASGLRLDVLWGADAYGYMLEGSANLVGGPWAIVPGTPLKITTPGSVRVDPTGPYAYFRLKKLAE